MHGSFLIFNFYFYFDLSASFRPLVSFGQSVSFYLALIRLTSLLPPIDPIRPTSLLLPMSFEYTTYTELFHEGKVVVEEA